MENTEDQAGAPTLRSIVEDAIAREGYVVEDVRVAGAADTPTVTVSVDRAEGTAGVDLDEVARLSGLVSAALDAQGDHVPGVGAGEYLLEVSSAGVERPLTTARHFARAVGRLVSVSVDGAEPVTARLLAAGEREVELAEVRPGAKKGMPAKQQEARTVALDRLGPATVQVEWGGTSQADPRAHGASGTSDSTEA